MRTMPILLLLLICTAFPSMSVARTITYYLDGAMVEYEAKARKGYLETSLPAVMTANSLRIKPLDDSSIIRVEIVPLKPNAKAAKEMAGLIERENLLKDRLKALDTREEIFKAAARSHSGRAVRKTKTNPDPMTNMRKGTEFAIAQLESVYAVRRRTENELAAVEARLTSQQKDSSAGGSVGKVWISKKVGRVHIAYLLPERRWTPLYDFRLDGTGFVHVVLRADYPVTDGTAAVFVVPLLLSEDSTGSGLRLAASERFGKVAEYKFPVEKEEVGRRPAASMSFTFKSPEGNRLPAGLAAGYLMGEFLGNANFGGCRPNESKTLTFGRQ
jgi:hypothetical protein